MLFIMIGVFSIRFPELVACLKKHDSHQWKLLDSPPIYAFSKSIGVYSWILEHGYEQSKSCEVKTLGLKSLHRALFARHTILLGVALVIIGFFAALAGV